MLRPKFLKLRVLRFSASGHSKKYAATELNLHPYAQAMTPISSQITLSTPHKTVPNLALVILALPANIAKATETVAFDETLTSSAVSDLTTDDSSAWDLSTSCPADKLSEFMGARRAGHSQLLSELALSRRPRDRPRPPRPEPPGAPSTGVNRFLGLSDPEADPPALTGKQLLARVAQFVPSFAWARGPVDAATCAPAAALYAAISASPLLRAATSEARFNAVFGALWTAVGQRRMIDAPYPGDFLVTALFLLALLRLPVPGAVKPRLDAVVEHAAAFAAAEFDAQVQRRAAHFHALLDEVVAPDPDVTRAAFTYAQMFRVVETPGALPPALHRVLVNAALARFDAALVERLLEHSELISVLYAAQVKPFTSTVTVSSFQAPIVLFDEALAVIMMSHAICGAREESTALLNEICPHLPKQVVVALLANQAVDDFNPCQNDTASLEAFFAEELVGSYRLVAPIEEGVAEAVAAMDVTRWKEADIPADAFKELPFFAEVFAVPS
jgi:hypothetical protein